jgi:putative inorganic carbon (HCO3(-)) transporter
MSDDAARREGDYGGRTDAEAKRVTPATVEPAATQPTGLERTAYISLLAFAAAPQISIAASGILLGLTALLWLALVIHRRERIEVPAMFWPLLAYAGITVVSAAFSLRPEVSFLKTKQLLLFAIVPIVYRLMQGRRTLTAVDVIITVGALNAIYGILQYAILNYDNLGRRVQGNLGHYMTYSGVIMLVACIAAARVMFREKDRLWAALIMPAIMVALALTFSRNAWVGACAGIGLLFLLRDFRLLAILPVAAALFIGFAPRQISERLYSTFSLTDPTNRDRLAMVRSGVHIIKDFPLTGVGPDMVIQVYPHYRDPLATKQLNPHLHNVPLQIAAERGLPALGIWVWFVVTLVRDFVRKLRSSALPSLPTAALAGVVAMLAAGMFEHNFGDSEFLMLFLVLVTLPYAADRVPAATAPAFGQHTRAA